MLRVKKLRCEYKKNPLGIDILIPRVSWQIDSTDRGVLQVAYRLQVSEEDSTFANIAWDTGKVISEQSIHVEYTGEKLKSRTRYYYRVFIWDNKGNESGWSEVAYWEMGLLGSGEWIVDWITIDTLCKTESGEPCQLLRKTFDICSKVKAARVYVSSLGLYELYINGYKVGEDLFTPGWTSYTKRIQYQTYDITTLLKTGGNTVGVMLGDGWFKGEISRQIYTDILGSQRAVILQLHIEYEDGREEIICSDPSWKGAPGPILYSDIYNGETYDAGLEWAGWNTFDFDDSVWKNAKKRNCAKDMLTAQENLPVRVGEEIKPVRIVITPKGETVLDMGQNMTGYVRFSVNGEAGAIVKLLHGEVLDKEGNFYSENLRDAKQTVTYILRGGKTETYKPYFSYQGFRYVKVEGYPGELRLENFTGLVIHSDLEMTGRFECSNELINKLQHNILWSQKGNFLDIPTDCPQRNERHGWTADAQVFLRTACFNMQVAPFFTKWLRDLKADQHKNGMVPIIIPSIQTEVQLSTSSAWGDGGVICPWILYLCYGDKRILQEQFESMKAWIEYMRWQGDNEFLWNTGFHFGDWLGLDAKQNSYTGATCKDFIASAFYAYSTDILIKAAQVLNKQEDVINYTTLYNRILEAFSNEFVTPAGRLAVPTQTAHVLALEFNLVEGNVKKRVADDLIKLIEESDFHLTTGFVGTPYICDVLSHCGHSDIAYRLLMQTDYPSWLYQIEMGATTIWEHWDGIKTDGTFWSPDMNSFNHYAYGSIGEWLYRHMAGIDTNSELPGFKRIVIKPELSGDFTYVKASLESIYGVIKSEWKNDAGNMEIIVEIPPNTTAVVKLPMADIGLVFENGTPISDAEGVIKYERQEKSAQVELGSGKYRFTFKLGASI